MFASNLAGDAASVMHYPPKWRERLCQMLGVPVTTEVLRFLEAWGQAEGGNAKWNPLNTTYTLPYGESWSYNSSKVQNYWLPTGGIAATGLTLIQTTFAGILGDMQAGKWSAEQLVTRNGAQIRIWGTNPDTILAVLKEA